MSDLGTVIITARKEVPDKAAARAIYDLVKQRFADKPEITITGGFSNRFDFTEED